MAVRTASSNGVRPSVRGSALAAFVFGLVGVACLPVAVAVAYDGATISYRQSTWAAIPAAVCGTIAIFAGRRAARIAQRSVLPVEGARLGRWGRRLGWLALYVAATAGLAVLVYAVETHYSS